MPPWLLASAMARTRPLRTALPQEERGPERSTCVPMSISCPELAGAAASAPAQVHNNAARVARVTVGRMEEPPQVRIVAKLRPGAALVKRASSAQMVIGRWHGYRFR